MPIYEYKCSQCGKSFSHLHRRLGESAPPCPDCGGPVQRLFSSFAAKVQQAGGCPHADSCPASGGHVCGPGCCHHHH